MPGLNLAGFIATPTDSTRWSRPYTAWSPAALIIPQRLWMAPVCYFGLILIIPWLFSSCAVISALPTRSRKPRPSKRTTYSANCLRSRAPAPMPQKSIAQRSLWLIASARPRMP